MGGIAQFWWNQGEGWLLAPSAISPQAEGLIDFVFDLPRDEEDQGDEATVWVQGKRGDFLSGVMADIRGIAGLHS